MSDRFIPSSPEAALIWANIKVRYWDNEAYKAQARIKTIKLHAEKALLSTNRATIETALRRKPAAISAQ